MIFLIMTHLKLLFKNIQRQPPRKVAVVVNFLKKLKDQVFNIKKDTAVIYFSAFFEFFFQNSHSFEYL